jgi:hypothetical protein
LSKGYKKGSRPTLLQIELPIGACALDMKKANHDGEFEYLLARGLQFEIINGEEIKVEGVAELVLRLTLKPQFCCHLLPK